MQIDPSGPITPGMLTPPNVADVTLKSLRANALDGSLPTLREANTKATDLEVKNGIGFQRMDAGGGRFLSVWMFKSFLIPKDVVVHFSNENPVAFVATTDATIVGVIDVRPYNQNDVLCGTELISGATLIAGGPGGGTGAILGTTSFAGQGVGGIPASGGGPGGGGYGFKGQDGGELSSSGSPGGAGGAVYGNASLDPLLGGSGGGGATVSGGGGGGAFQLVAGHMVVIGDGTAVGGINAGGCGGLGSPSGTRAGAGGSGGSILIETPLLDMRAKSGLAANGGNAGIIGGANGADTQISADRIATSLGVGVGGAGGIYGGGNANSGNPGNAGGGSVGRIRLNLRASSYTLPAGAILSPSTTSFAGSSPTSIGTLDIR